jgi:hypothetical protein
MIWQWSFSCKLGSGFSIIAVRESLPHPPSFSQSFGNLIYSVHWAHSKDEEVQDVRAVVQTAMRQYSRSVMSSRNMSSGYNDGSSRSFRPDHEMRLSGNPDPFPRKAEHEANREEYAQLRIPTVVAENAEIAQITTASVGTGSQTSSPDRTTPVNKTSLAKDVLPNKDSWGGLNMVGLQRAWGIVCGLSSLTSNPFPVPLQVNL